MLVPSFLFFNCEQFEREVGIASLPIHIRIPILPKVSEVSDKVVLGAVNKLRHE